MPVHDLPLLVFATEHRGDTQVDVNGSRYSGHLNPQVFKADVTSKLRSNNQRDVLGCRVAIPEPCRGSFETFFDLLVPSMFVTAKASENSHVSTM